MLAARIDKGAVDRRQLLGHDVLFRHGHLVQAQVVPPVVMASSEGVPRYLTATAALVLAAALKTVLIHRALHGPMGDEGKAIRQADYARALVTVALSLAGPALLLYWAPGAPAPALAVGAAVRAGTYAYFGNSLLAGDLERAESEIDQRETEADAARAAQHIE